MKRPLVNSRMKRETPTGECRDGRHYKGHLRQLVKANRAVIAAIDEQFKRLGNPPDRGQKMGQITGSLAYATDSAYHFGLDTELSTTKTRGITQ